MVSALGKAVEFFREFGLFDVILPFLLVFTVVFAILEKTEIFGKEGDHPKRALNSMVAFVVGMLVVATNKVVNVINTSLPNITLLLVFIVMFLMLVGVFYNQGKFDFAKDHAKLTATFVIALLVGVILIVFDAIKLESGESWLEYGWIYLVENISGAVVGSIVFAILAIATVVWITGSAKPKPAREDEEHPERT